MSEFSDEEISASKKVAAALEGPGRFDGVSTETTLLLSGDKKFKDERTRGVVEFVLAVAAFIIAAVKLALEYRKLKKDPPDDINNKIKDSLDDEEFSELTDNDKEFIINEVLKMIFEDIR